MDNSPCTAFFVNGRPPRFVPLWVTQCFVTQPRRSNSLTVANAPAPVFVPTEDGLSEIDCDRFPLATTFEEVPAALKDLNSEEHDYETVVLDSVSGLERIIFDALCRQYSVSCIEKVDGGYARGYTHALGYWRQILGALNNLRVHRGMVIICIAHAKVEKFEDPESSAYDRFSPRLHKHAAALLCEWADAVLFAMRKFRTQKEDAGFKRQRTIATALGKGGVERIIRCVGGPSCIAKNRYSIAEKIPLNWAALVKAISDSRDQGAKTNG